MDLLTPLLKKAEMRPAELAHRLKVRPSLICDLRHGRKKRVSPTTARGIVDIFAKELGEKAVEGLFEKLLGFEPRGNGHASR